ncbi:AraC family transcriptional regulator [Streptomyces sp. NPDC051940]|uniref:helix-turn-helix domain-containing protein n=1 Tax=Streptomyces sp. NPDC051940 TaxID=3155675 RepID=UPI00342729BD
MRTAQEVLAGPRLAVHAVTCADDRPGWSEPEASGAVDRVQVVLVRRGGFRLASEGRDFTVDRLTGYVELPGQERAFAHPAGGDSCTAVTVDGGLWRELTGDGRSLPPAFHVDGALDVAHRRLLLAGDPFTAVDELAVLLGRAFRGHRLPVTAGPGARTLADRARDAVLAEQALRLEDLARALDVSPAHLSRTFRHHMGMTLGRFRNRVRVDRALDRLQDGDALAAVAADLGFADQAHLTRVVKAETGSPPGALRAAVRAGG